MLQKKSFFKYFVNQSKKILTNKNSIRCTYAIQTNGVLIDKDWCDVFKELDINVGISLDGIKKVNDTYRVDHQNRGSYDRTIKGLKIAQQHLKTPPGILSVIDINADPEQTYQHLKELGVTSYDLKWPYANHDLVPNRIASFDFISEETPYADWLIKVFDLWFIEKPKSKPKIRIFETIVALILGSDEVGNEDFGVKENKVLCIQTNGDLEAVGALNLCGNGFTKSNATISTVSLSEGLQTKLAKIYHKSHKKLHKKCLNCPIRELCGGGHIVSRYSKDNGFNNVSVYCKDYMKLFSHIQNKIYDSFPKKYRDQFDRITYDELHTYFEKLHLDEIVSPKYIQELKF